MGDRKRARRPRQQEGAALWRVAERALALVRRHVDAGRTEAARLSLDEALEAWYEARERAPEAALADRRDALRDAHAAVWHALHPRPAHPPAARVLRLPVVASAGAPPSDAPDEWLTLSDAMAMLGVADADSLRAARQAGRKDPDHWAAPLNGRAHRRGQLWGPAVAVALARKAGAGAVAEGRARVERRRDQERMKAALRDRKVVQDAR